MFKNKKTIGCYMTFRSHLIPVIRFHYYQLDSKVTVTYLKYDVHDLLLNSYFF